MSGLKENQDAKEIIGYCLETVQSKFS